MKNEEQERTSLRKKVGQLQQGRAYGGYFSFFLSLKNHINGPQTRLSSLIEAQIPYNMIQWYQ